MICKCKKYQCGAPAKYKVLVSGTFIPLCKFCVKKCYEAHDAEPLTTPTTDSSFTPTRGKRPLP